MSVVLAVGWVAFVLLGARRLARSARSLPLPGAHLAASGSGRGGNAPTRPRGRSSFRPREVSAVGVGVAAAVAAALAVTISLPLALLGVVAVAVACVGRTRRAHRRAEAAVIAELPEIVDLFVLAVAGGLTVPLAVGAVARRAPPTLGPALAVVARAVDDGVRSADALELLPSLVGDPARPLVSTLAGAVRYGVPVGPALERLATEVRLERRRRAEEEARRVPVKLLFPLVLCILPAFALLTVLPLLAGTLRSLRL